MKTKIKRSIDKESYCGVNITAILPVPTVPAFCFMGVHSRKQFDRDFYTNSTYWNLATINNAAYDYYKMCESTGITKPPVNLKILVAKMGNSAPMCRRLLGLPQIITDDILTNMLSIHIQGTIAGTGIGATAVALATTLMKYACPDITIKASISRSKDFYSTVNHELSHASHFSQVGPVFWGLYVSYIVSNYLDGNDTYGDINYPNSGICGVGEMWGYSMGNIQKEEKYPNTTTMDTAYTAGKWFKSQIIYRLIQEGHLTKKQIYDCLTFDIVSHNMLKTRLIATYPNKQREIKEIFEYYGF